MNGLIYHAFCTTNGKCYVGQTIRSLKSRRGDHLSKARCGSKDLIHNAIRKYGISAFDWTVLTTNIHDQIELDTAEIYWVAFFKSFGPEGYNETPGGAGWVGHNRKGRKQTPEWIEKRAAANRGKKLGPQSPELVARRAAALRGKKKPPRTQEHAIKIAMARRGKKDTLETRTSKSRSQLRSYALNPERRLQQSLGMKRFKRNKRLGLGTVLEGLLPF